MSLFSKSRPAPKQAKEPSLKGAFTIDSRGSIVSSTVPASFSASLQRELAGAILAAFREAQAAQLTLTELVFEFCGLRVTAKELRGGAIVFLHPLTPENQLAPTEPVPS
jgi:hypothetical protein